MLRLHQLFFINFLLIFSGTFIVSALISYYTIRDIQVKTYQDQLENNINIIETHLPDVKNLQSYIKQVHQKTRNHLSIISLKGKILANSSVSKLSEIKYINAFPELKDASQQVYGSVIRFDSDLNKEMFFVAKKVRFMGEEIFIRIGIEASTIMDNFRALWLRILVVFLFSIGIGLIVARAINENIKNELDNISNYLQAIAEKKYKTRLKTPFTREFDAISSRLKKLAKKLEKREKKLRKYTANLRLRNRQNNEILSAISHEFKNPVAVVIGYSETLLDDQDMDINTRQRFLNKVHNNAKKISALIDRLTLSIKLENKAMEPSLTTFNIYEVCSEVVASMREKYKEREIEIHGQTRLIEADKTLIEVVLVNLVENAIKYSEDTVSIEITPNTIRISDKGIGISEEDIKKITKKFYRVDQNTWESSLGLGLAIVKYILKIHKSSLKIESIKDQGSTFWFEI